MIGSGVIASVANKVARLAAMARAIHAMAGPHLYKLYIACGMLLLRGLAEGAFVVVLVSVVTNILGSVDLPPFFKDVAVFLGVTSTPGVSAQSLIIVIAFLALQQIVYGLTRTYVYAITPEIVTYIRDVVLANLFAARFAYLDRFETGTFRQVLTQECGRTVAAAQSMILLAGQLITMFTVLGLMFSMSAGLALVTLGAALALVPLRLIYARMLNRYESRSLDQQFALNNILDEIITNIRPIKLVGIGRQFADRMWGVSMRTMWLRAYSMILQTWDPLFLYVAALAFISSLILLNSGLQFTTNEHLLAFFVIVYRMLPPAVSASAALNQVLANEPHVLATMRFYQPETGRQERDTGELLAPQPIDRIALENVSFGYRDGQTALRHVSLEARRGQITALVGPSGAGKSSIFNLLLGMYERGEGRVVFEGPDWSRDIDEIHLSALRDLIGVVTQDISLLNETVREAIRGGDAAITDADVEMAAKRADAHDFILQLENGYDTVVGQRGILLSGGQRQRLLIAQILARRTPVLILDEATSALDVLSERRVYDTLDERKNDCLILVITHRLASVEHCERIYVMNEGAISESGSWGELMDRRGALYEMARKPDRAAAQ
jgi:subfamily B ATP-binding cassette protein MsbA